METQITIAQTKIENGSKFNGVVYTKFYGKNWVTIFIYLDGAFFKICEVQKSDLETTKKQIEQSLCVSPSLPKNEWVINGKTVQNNLSYGEMWNRYGTDFE